MICNAWPYSSQRGGIAGADALAERWRLRHPYNELCQANRHRMDADLPRQSTDLPSECSWVHSKEGGVADDGTSVSPKEGDKGNADESVSEGSDDIEGILPSSMNSGSSSDEYEQFLSQFLGDDEPGRRKATKGRDT